ALEEKQPDGDRGGDSGQCPDPDLQPFGGQFHRAQDQREFNALSQHHQEYKKEDSPRGSPAGPRRIPLNLVLNIFFQVARNAIHPYDHRNDEAGGHQIHQPLKAVFADPPALQSDGNAQAQRRRGGDTKPDESRQLRAAGPGKIDQDNADDQRGLDALSKSDDEG
ncbi:MAG TPA: hypothetical protein VGG61_00420, partial [Gemmataceae bacterium]